MSQLQTDPGSKPQPRPLPSAGDTAALSDADWKAALTDDDVTALRTDLAERQRQAALDVLRGGVNDACNAMQKWLRDAYADPTIPAPADVTELLGNVTVQVAQPPVMGH
jgi:hypothetical protein